jgi:hypothetical protein
LHFTIEPLVGAGPLRLGADELEIEAAIGKPERRGTTRSGDTVLNYEGATLVFDSRSGALRKITLFPPSAVEFKGIQLFSSPYVLKKIAGLTDCTLQVDRWRTVWAHALGLPFSGLHTDEDWGPVASVYDKAWLDERSPGLRSELRPFKEGDVE